MKKSINGKYWSNHSYNEQMVSDLSRIHSISDFQARLLSSRVDSIDDSSFFLKPRLKAVLPDPFHLLDMDVCVDRAMQAIESKESICVFADYDVDGATSSALLKNIFNEIGVNINIYVPDRIKEGYGPSVSGMQKLHDEGVSLLITVDCGSVAFEPLEAAKELGMDVIVIDHHISLDILPKCIGVINPNRLDETSNCKHLAAAGVSFLFAIALIQKLKKSNYFINHNIEEPNLMQHLDLVALGTVCDVMSLTGINRAFVSQGIKVMNHRNNIGLRALCDIAQIEDQITSYHLGYLLGPRINAGGRVGQSSLGATLLSTHSIEEAGRIAQDLDKHNQERKALEHMMLEEAFEMAESQDANPVIFVASEGWHPGVIGIIAGRLKEKYNKPSAVVSLHNGIGKASCRSIRGVDFGSKIIKAHSKGLLLAGGGHAMAAGFSVSQEKINLLQDFLNMEVASDLEKSDEVHLKEYYDAELSINSVNYNLMSEIKAFEPFGVGNQEPIFKFSNVYAMKSRIVGEKHIKTMLSPVIKSYGLQNTLDCISFNSVVTQAGKALLSPSPENMSVIGKLKINKWQAQERVQLNIIDIVV